MRAQVTLLPHESKRLIAKAVAAWPSVKKALADHCIIIATGTTNAYVVEELLGYVIEPRTRYAVGVFADGLAAESEESGRITPIVVTKGIRKPDDFHWRSYLPEIKPGDVFIKGGNAIDHSGLAAIAAANDTAGVIGSAWGAIFQRGIEFLMPIGLEKLIPDVRTAVDFQAGYPAEIAMGNRFSLMPSMGAKVITEITALETLFGLKAVCIASGGVVGSEGAVTLLAEGSDNAVGRAVEMIQAIKKQKNS
jgi:hypothetical protein